eukprot:COSAG02_NODE_1319_length_13272_cov_10.015714_1_plen_385_part_00
MSYRYTCLDREEMIFDLQMRTFSIEVPEINTSLCVFKMSGLAFNRSNKRRSVLHYIRWWILRGGWFTITESNTTSKWRLGARLGARLSRCLWCVCLAGASTIAASTPSRRRGACSRSSTPSRRSRCALRRRALRSRSVQPSHSGPHPICPFPQLGSTAVGIQVPDGVLLAVEKRITSPLLEPESIEKIMEVDSHLGCSMSGLTADARTLIDHARIETQNHRFTYDTPMTVEATTQSICDLALGFGEGGEKSMVRPPPPFPPSPPPVPRACVLLLWGHLGRAYAQRFVAREQSRPYGVALLLAGVDDKDGPVLYHTDPSGTFVRFKAKAIGSGSEGAQTNLQEALADGTDVSPPCCAPAVPHAELGETVCPVTQSSGDHCCWCPD